MYGVNIRRSVLVTRGQIIRQYMIFLAFCIYLKLVLFFYQRMKQPVREALGNKSAVVSLVSISIVSSVQHNRRACSKTAQ